MNESQSFLRWRNRWQIVIGRKTEVLYIPSLGKVGGTTEKRPINPFIIWLRILLHCDRPIAGKCIRNVFNLLCWTLQINTFPKRSLIFEPWFWNEMLGSLRRHELLVDFSRCNLRQASFTRCPYFSVSKLIFVSMLSLYLFNLLKVRDSRSFNRDNTRDKSLPICNKFVNVQATAVGESNRNIVQICFDKYKRKMNIFNSI